MFAGSCIGVICLVMSLEFLRRLSAEFDKYIAGQTRSFSFRAPFDAVKNPDAVVGESSSPSQNGAACAPSRRVRPTLLQHIIRSLLHMLQFGVAYFVMLLAMYYNGYFIICILIGSFLGYFVFSWNAMEKKYVYLRTSIAVVLTDLDSDACAVTVCCG